MSTSLETESAPEPVESQAPAQTAVIARPGVRAIAMRLSFVVAIIALDLWSKAAAFAWLERLKAADALVLDQCERGHERYPLVGEWLTFMLSLNPGAAFGQLDSWPYLLVGGRIFAGLFLVWLLFRTPSGRPWLVAAFVLILGGALGNLYDNLLRARTLVDDRWYSHAQYPFGPVRDFIDVYFAKWSWHFPTFNVADSCITIGAILLLATSLASGTDKRSKANAARA